MTLFDFFIDPILRAPTLGSMFMCMAAAIVGVLVFVRKQSLLGEALSHATYPGVTLAVLIGGIGSFDEWIGLLIFTGAFLSSIAGFWLIRCLKCKLRVSEDSALCFVLTLFFGVGVTVASYTQFAYPHLFRQIQAYLYGQTATMIDLHIFIYGGLALLILLVIFLFYKEIFVLSFDAQFAQSIGINGRLIETAIVLLIGLSLVMAIRGIGLILTSAMLIAPAVSARQFTHSFKQLLFLSALLGLISAFCGNYLSLRLGLPVGPIIVLVAGGFALYALLWAPERGLFVRGIRVASFRMQRIQENLLKSIWRLTEGGKYLTSFSEIMENQSCSKFYLRLLLFRLKRRGWVKRAWGGFALTVEGTQRGGQIVRLHRLWEVYLVNALGMGAQRVHSSAEEMEHILTPSLEKKLTELLNNPMQDPHHQPIPSQEEVMGHH
ncbi:MAG: iron chelate uptake ABC transporter family permease subunit [Chlamydiales bacterium]